MNIEHDAAIEPLQLYGTIDLSVPLEKVLDRIKKAVPIEYEKKENGTISIRNQMSNMKNRMPMEKN